MGGDCCKKLSEERLPSCFHVQVCGVGGEDGEDLQAFHCLASAGVPQTLGLAVALQQSSNYLL